MKIWLGIFLGLILIMLATHLKINVMYLTKQKKSLKIHFKINFGLYLFGLIKIAGISLKEDGIHFLCFKFPYNKMKIDKDSMKVLKDFSISNLLKSLHLKLEQFHLNLKIGTEEMMLTMFFVFAISTFLSILLAKNCKPTKSKNYDYKITPVYNQNQLSFEFSSKISMKTFHVIQMLILIKQNIKKKKEKNVQTKRVLIKI